MYYKIINQESEVYKQLHALRTKEHQIEKDNRDAVNAKVGLDYSQFMGHHGQQNFGRTTQYIGFVFKEPDKVDPKVWKRDKKHPQTFIPNTRTKAGQEMSRFLFNGLESSHFGDVFEILGIERPIKFTFPYVEISGETVLVFLGDSQEPNSTDLIEITKKEFEETLKLK